MPPITQALGRLSELLAPPTPHEVAVFFGHEPPSPADEGAGGAGGEGGGEAAGGSAPGGVQQPHAGSAAGGVQQQTAEGSAAGGGGQQLAGPQSRRSLKGTPEAEVPFEELTHTQRVGVGCGLRPVSLCVVFKQVRPVLMGLVALSCQEGSGWVP